MKIAVMGAGAVGCYYGAMLARAGHSVVLIGRPALVEVVTREGLLLESKQFTGRVPMQADASPAAVKDADLVLFCVKSGDTESAGAAIAPHLSPQASVLSMQNGVDNAARLSTVIGRHAIPVVVYVATEMAGPGHVRHHGRGDLAIGPSDASAAIATLMTAAGLPSEVSDRVFDALWTKLVINCAYNGLSAISQLPYGELVRLPHVLETMRSLFDECVVVAQADGITLPDNLWQSLLDISVNMAAQRSSTAQDLARRKKSEIEHLNGYVVRRGRELGVAAPVNRALLCAVQLLESKSPETSR
ncbi:MAG: 2-dehydropantoate 2-reductase [Gammaproteobacteria bacterium]